jgi:hypothetical protein
MTDRHQQLAHKVVEGFRAMLSENARQQISQTELNELTLMIREALSEELESAVASVEELARTLRENIDKPELGL